MNFQFVDPWHLFLPREGGHVVGISGSGGKTSLLRRLAEHYLQEQVPVVLTTTTRTEPLAGIRPVGWDDLERAVGGGEPCFLRSGVSEDGKWLGPDRDQVDRLGERLPDHVVLAEVDGAAKKPLKFYRAAEPVWPARTSLALVVAGLQGMDEPAGQVVYRFGREPFAPLADLTPQTLWNWDHLHALLTGPGGYLDRVPAGVPAVMALAGMGQVGDSIGLFEFMGRVMRDERVPLAMFCELTGDERSLRTVCRTEDPEGGRE